MTMTRARWLIPAQALIAVVAIAVLTLWPPASGAMLLIPLRGTDDAGIARMALAGGALLIGTGPFPGSLVVAGDRAQIARRIRSWDVVILAAPPAACGTIGASA